MRHKTDAIETVGRSFLLRAPHLLFLLLCVTSIGLTVMAAPSDLDPTFGDLGRVVSSPDGSDSISGRSMALQSDGKIVIVGGRYLDGADFPTGFIIARYNSDGTLDKTFGNNGWSSATFGTQYESALSVDIQPDGKIVVGGEVSAIGDETFRDFAVARFDSDGQLDTTFDSDGKVTVSFNPEVVTGFAYEFFTSVKIASDGKIVLAGRVESAATSSRFALARLNSDGSLDTTFGANGRVVSGSENSYARLHDLTVLKDGAIVVAARAFNGRMAQKFNADGGLEWTYSVFCQNCGDEFNGVAAQTDGKLVFVGRRSGGVAAIRLNADGTVDNSFINATGPFGSAVSVAIQPDGKIVANFSTEPGYGDNRNSFSLIRYNASGSLDPSFGSGGVANVGVTTGLDYGRKVLIQPDGKILVGGYSTLSDPTRHFISMARFKGESALPDNPLYDYDGDGRSDISVFRPSDGVWYLDGSTSGFSAMQFGIATDMLAPADYDGDGKTDIAIYREGTWWILQSGDNVVRSSQFGTAEDKPQPGDWDGDGITDLAVYRDGSSTGGQSYSYYRPSSLPAVNFRSIPWGAGGDKRVSGDFDGDGKWDAAVFRPSNETWYILRSSDGQAVVQRFGLATDIPVPADYDGDGTTDIAMYRPATGVWYTSTDPQTNYGAVQFGISTDIPAPADFDGDGRADIAVFRPSNGVWYIANSSNASFTIQQFGLDGDSPTQSAYNY